MTNFIAIVSKDVTRFNTSGKRMTTEGPDNGGSLSEIRANDEVDDKSRQDEEDTEEAFLQECAFSPRKGIQVGG